jgi:hypothetical protein
MVKKEGKVYESVAARLRVKGVDTKGLEVFCTNRGPDHLILLNGETVGEYNHVSKRLFLYSEIINGLE